MENTKQRVEMILNYKGINAKQLSELCGYDRPQIIYDILNEKTKSISQMLSIKISSALPEINRTWLLTGEGSMLIGIDEETNAMKSISSENTKIINDMSEIIKSQQDTIKRLLDENIRLQNELSKLYSSFTA